MKTAAIIDQIYVWQGFGDGMGGWRSSCRLRIFAPHPEQSVVVFADDPENDGTSIPNCVEHLMRRVVREFRLNPLETLWVHHSPQYDGAEGEIVTSQVSLSTDSDGRVQPIWKNLEHQVVEGWIGQRLSD